MFNEVELTDKQKQQWEDTMSLMQWTCPGFRHLWYRLLAERSNAGKTEYVGIMTPDTPNACTDAKNIMFNPEWFFALSLPERLYVCAHEVMHNVYGDVEFLHQCTLSGKVPMSDGSTLPFDNATMQRAMDYRINALLDVSGSGNRPLGARPSEGNFDPDTSPNDALVDVYQRHYQDQPDGADGDQPSDAGNGKGNGSGFDTVAPPGKSTGQNPSQAAQQRNPQQWAVEMAAAQHLEQMRHQGRLPGALQLLFDQILTPEVDWREHLRSEVSRHTGTGHKNWMKPDRRFDELDIYLPSKSGFGVEWIVVYGDTSGSISSDEITSYLGELSGILEDINPRRLTILWGDTRVAQIDEITSAADLRNVKPLGGGGSDSRPMFDWVADQQAQPDVFIGFTDGFIAFPDRAPKYEVIWCDVAGSEYPFGDVVRIRRGKK